MYADHAAEITHLECRKAGFTRCAICCACRHRHAFACASDWATI